MSNTFIKSDGGLALSGFKVRKRMGNCVPRALAIAFNRPYKEVWDELFELGKSIGEFPNTDRCYSKYLKQHGWKKQKAQRTKGGRLKKLKYFHCLGLTALVHVRRHLVCVKDGKIIDDWNPGRYRAGIYWTKEGELLE
jgi:hypothetical protein|tara:strand:- start:32 stop:445 length:414 start_codon:yes stop_codon:yes gene_type:complete